MKKLFAFVIAMIAACSCSSNNDTCDVTLTGCYDDIAVNCHYGYSSVFDNDCRASGLVCAQKNQDRFDCATPCSAADVGKYAAEGFCQEDGVLATYVCRKNQFSSTVSGARYYYESTTIKCPNGCVKGQCVKYHPDEGMECDNNYIGTCVDNVKSFCKMGTVASERCRLDVNGPRVCAIDTDNLPICAEPCNPADTENEFECQTYNDNKEYSVETGCISDGNVNYFGYKETLCPDGCTASTGLCTGVRN